MFLAIALEQFRTFVCAFSGRVHFLNENFDVNVQHKVPLMFEATPVRWLELCHQIVAWLSLSLGSHSAAMLGSYFTENILLSVWKES